ncbi:MAG: hypothetical protein Q8M98_07040 [Candidatus Cloacimonadaceae bacterium]|nr:hypothetical protein [Candidatus Cloacimonadaceae bacterium]
MKTKILTLLLAFLRLVSIVEALTRTVNIDGTGQYTSIQAAINASSPGDTVLVYPGRYLENISIIQKSNISVISLEATSGNATIVEDCYTPPIVRKHHIGFLIVVNAYPIGDSYF